MTRIRESEHLGTVLFTDLATDTTISAEDLIAGASGGSGSVQSVTAESNAAINVGGTAADPTVGVIPAAHVDPGTGTASDIINALIAANLMAAS